MEILLYEISFQIFQLFLCIFKKYDPKLGPIFPFFFENQIYS